MFLKSVWMNRSGVFRLCSGEIELDAKRLQQRTRLSTAVWLQASPTGTGLKSGEPAYIAVR
jgi:hypothetical protein